MDDWQQDAARLNARLHALIGVTPCETACNHSLGGWWTILGVANVAARNGQPEGASRE